MVQQLAQKLHPDLAMGAAFERLMAEQILQYSARLAPAPVDVSVVAALYRRFSKSLKQIFQYYASEASGEHKEGAAACRTSSKLNSRANVRYCVPPVPGLKWLPFLHVIAGVLHTVRPPVVG